MYFCRELAGRQPRVSLEGAEYVEIYLVESLLVHVDVMTFVLSQGIFLCLSGTIVLQYGANIMYFSKIIDR